MHLYQIIQVTYSLIYDTISEIKKSVIIWSRVLHAAMPAATVDQAS